MKKFEVGKTYRAIFIGDQESILRMTIAKRTAKTLTTTEGKLFKIKTTEDDLEFFMPCGRYSMAPVMSAKNEERT